MKWTDGTCKLTEELSVDVWEWSNGEWSCAAYSHNGDGTLWTQGPIPTEAAAKEAAAEWVRKTMAQFGNALADSDEPRYYVTDAGRKALLPDDGC